MARGEGRGGGAQGCRGVSDPFEHLEPLSRDEIADFDGLVARAAYSRNDLGNARRLNAVLGDDLWYLPGRGWAVFDGRRYVAQHGDIAARERAQRLEELIVEEARALAALDVTEDEIRAAVLQGAAKLAKLDSEEIADLIRRRRFAAHYDWAIKCGDCARVNSALAALEPLRLVDIRKFDAAAMRLTLENCTLDLGRLAPMAEAEIEDETIAARAAAMVEHDRADRATKLATVAFDPRATCPRWLHLLEGMFPEAEDRAYVQRVCGYFLRGDNHKQVFVLLRGAGGNGKSTLMGFVRAVLGDSFAGVREDAFVKSKNGGGEGPNPAEVTWVGARVLFADEVQKGALDAALLKSLTGGSPRETRGLHQPMFTWDPRGVPVLNINKLPNLGDDSEGMFRRALVVNWRHRLLDLDQRYHMTEGQVGAMIREEAAGFLNWMIDGYRMFIAPDDQGRETGFAMPASARAVMAALRSEADPLGDFLRECTVRVQGGRIANTDLSRVFAAWADQAGTRAYAGTQLTRAMRDRDIGETKSSGISWVGLDWITPAAAEEAGVEEPERHAGRVADWVANAPRPGKE